MDKTPRVSSPEQLNQGVILRSPRPSEDRAPAVWTLGDILLGRYEVTGILGAGGMGTVYKVYDRHANLELAVKSPKPELFTTERDKENFVREAETWVKLRVHTYLVTCYYVHTMSGIPRIFAEYIAGGSLADWIEQRTLYVGGPDRTLERILDVAIQFAWGLHAAHEQGLVHQDVKPANVMLTPDGIAKVTDFGLAKARALAGEPGIQVEGVQTSILVSSGGMTPAYCSPEQATRQDLSRKTDIWSWGLSVLQMFTGRVTWRVGVEAPAVLVSHKGGDPTIPPIPASVVNLLARCFRKSPEDRPATMLEVATELQAIYRQRVGHAYTREAPKAAELERDKLINQGISLRHLGRLQEALQVYEQAIRLDPTDPAAYSNKGIVLMELGREEEALQVYEQAIHLDPTYHEAYQNKGVALASLGRKEEALRAYEEVVRLNPTLARVHFNKGNALSALGRPEQALLAYDQAIRLDPAGPHAYLNKGLVLAGLGRREEALHAYDQAIRLDPTLALNYTNKGAVLAQLGRLEEALQAHEQAIRLEPTNALAYVNKSYALIHLGRTQEALHTLEQAIRLDPTFALAHTNKGLALLELGWPKEALLAFEESLRLDSTNPMTYVGQSLALTALGRARKAQQAQKKAQQLERRG